MPAGSSTPPPTPSTPTLPRTWRPLGPLIMGAGVTTALVVIVGFGWFFSFDAETRGKFTTFQRGTLIFFGLIYLSLMFALLRSRAVAYADRLVVVNGFKRRELAWPQVVAARLPPGAPWVTLDLADGETCSLMGIQGSDGARARRALRELKTLVAQSGPTR